jgi:hypothetical protein
VRGQAPVWKEYTEGKAGAEGPGSRRPAMVTRPALMLGYTARQLRSPIGRTGLQPRGWAGYMSCQTELHWPQCGGAGDMARAVE